MKKILSSLDNINLMASKKIKYNQNSMRSGSENEEIGYEINQSSEINNLITISSTNNNNNNLYFKNNININNNNNNNKENIDLTPSRNLMSNIKRKKIQIETDETNFNTNKNISTTNNNNNNNIIINNLTNKLNTISTLNNINSNKNNNNNYLNKINELNNIISDLLNYKNLCENFIKILIPNKIFPINEKDLIDYKSFNLNNNENEKILEEQILINNEQKNYIEILKQTIESDLIKNELNFKEKNENNNNNKFDILIEFTKLKIENEKIKKDLILEQAVLIELKSEFESIKKLNDELKEKNDFLENNKNNEIIINNSNIEKLKIENQNQKNLLENQIKLFEEEQKKKKDF